MWNKTLFKGHKNYKTTILNFKQNILIFLIFMKSNAIWSYDIISIFTKTKQNLCCFQSQRRCCQSKPRPSFQFFKNQNLFFKTSPSHWVRCDLNDFWEEDDDIFRWRFKNMQNKLKLQNLRIFYFAEDWIEPELCARIWGGRKKIMWT